MGSRGADRPIVWVGVAASIAGGAALLVAVPRADPIGPDRVGPLQDVRWETRADPPGGVAVDGGALKLWTEADGRAVAWAPLGVEASDAAAWLLRASVTAPSPGRSVRVVLAADGEPPLWVGSQRIDSRRAEPRSEAAWVPVEQVIPVSLRGRRVRVGVVAKGPGVAAEVRALSLVPAAPRASRGVGRAALVAGGAGALWLLWRRAGALAAATAAAFVVGASLPSPWLARVYELGWWLHVGPYSAAFLVQKGLGHFGVFAVLAGLLARQVSTRVALGGMAVFAVGTEAAQRLSVGRSASLADVALDLAGAALGIAVSRRFAARARRGSAANPP